MLTLLMLMLVRKLVLMLMLTLMLLLMLMRKPVAVLQLIHSPAGRFLKRSIRQSVGGQSGLQCLSGQIDEPGA